MKAEDWPPVSFLDLEVADSRSQEFVVLDVEDGWGPRKFGRGLHPAREVRRPCRRLRGGGVWASSAQPLWRLKDGESRS